MREDRILRLAEFIRYKNDVMAFRMMSTLEISPPGMKHRGCIAGHAILLFEPELIKTIRITEVMDTAEDILGLEDFPGADALFIPHGINYSSVKRKHASRVLTILAVGGEIDWGMAMDEKINTITLELLY